MVVVNGMIQKLVRFTIPASIFAGIVECVFLLCVNPTLNGCLNSALAAAQYSRLVTDIEVARDNISHVVNKTSQLNNANKRSLV